MRRNNRGRGRHNHHHHPRDDSFLRNLTAATQRQQQQQNGGGDFSVSHQQEEHKFFRQSRVAKALDHVVPIGLFGQYRHSYPQIVSETSRFLQEALYSGVAHVGISFGRIVGRGTKQAVRLPILSDALLAPNDLVSGNATIEFDTDLTEAEANDLRSNILRAVAPRLQEGSLLLESSERIVERYGAEFEVERDISSKAVVSCVRKRPLESLVVYRAGEEIHLKLESHTVASCEAAEIAAEGLVEPADRRVVEQYLFREGGGGGVIEWQLEVHKEEGIFLGGGGASGWAEDESGGPKTRAQLCFGSQLWAVLTSLAASESGGEECAEILRVFGGLFVYNGKLAATVATGELRAAPEKVPKSRFYYPSLFGDIVADTRRHYNLKKIGLAAQSAIEIVRRMNNQAKRYLIGEYVASGASVLDLACGHGQDLLKYREKDLKVFIGVDVSDAEIREARTRHHRQQSRSSGQACPARFHVGNVLVPQSYEKFLIKSGSSGGEPLLMDVVSMQLAIHYTLGTRENAELVLGGIAKRLKPGGIFIGSCPSSFAIYRRMRESLVRDLVSAESSSAAAFRYIFGNEVYSVTFAAEEFAKIRGSEDTDVTAQMARGLSAQELAAQVPIRLPGDPTLPRHAWLEDFLADKPPGRVDIGFGDRDAELHHLIDDDPLFLQLSERWGLKYTFWLVDHIDADEFIVPWRAFCRLALSHGLLCLFASPFDEYCHSMLNKANLDAAEFDRRIQDLINNSPTAPQQKEVISFYHVFAFEKLLTNNNPDTNFALRPPVLSKVARAQAKTATPHHQQQLYAAPAAAPQQQLYAAPTAAPQQQPDNYFQPLDLNPWDIDQNLMPHYPTSAAGSFTPMGAFAPSAGSFVPNNNSVPKNDNDHNNQNH